VEDAGTVVGKNAVDGADLLALTVENLVAGLDGGPGQDLVVGNCGTS
jgi:hypothetical protein